MDPWHDDDDISPLRDNMRVAPVNVGSDPRVLVPPADRRKIVYLTFCILGISALSPWTFFTTPSSYWMYKFRDVNATDDDVDPHDKTELQKTFLSYLSLVATTTSTACLILNALCCQRIHISYRIMGSFFGLFLLFVVTTCLVDVDTDDYQTVFFISTLVSVGLMNAVDAVFMGSLAGLSGKFPPSYISAYAIGQALSGLIAAVSRVITLLIGASDEGSAFVYFLFADVVLLFGGAIYFCASRHDFFLHYQYLGLFEEGDDMMALKSMRGLVMQRDILGKVWEEAVSGALALAVTICITPSLFVLAVSESHEDGTMWSNELFIPICGFVMFNLGDLFGRIIAGWLHWPSVESRGITLFLAVLRCGMVPLFMLCNLHPRNYLPVILESDFYFVTFVLILGLTNGHLCNICMINAPRRVAAHQQETVGLLMAAFLGMGTCVGALLAIVAVHFI